MFTRGKELFRGLQAVKGILFMDFKTFSDIHFIVKTQEVINIPSNQDFSYSFLLDVEFPQAVDSTFSFIFSKSNNGLFSVTIPLSKNVSVKEAWLNKLYLILSHSEYKKYNNKLIIGFFSKNDSGYPQHVFFQQLGLELAKQNFDVLFINFNQLGINNTTSLFFYFNDLQLTDEVFYDWYLNKLNNSTSVLNLFYRYSNIESVESIITQREITERKMMNEVPSLYKLIQKNIIFSTREQQLKLIIQSLKVELSSKTAYLDFLLSRNTDELFNNGIDLIPSMKIKKFYYQEYEILPLWYKRIGHIIKVIMGKRTFRSLFNDNVKKYKD
jgi:hypothetical protein